MAERVEKLVGGLSIAKPSSPRSIPSASAFSAATSKPADSFRHSGQPPIGHTKNRDLRRDDMQSVVKES